MNGICSLNIRTDRLYEFAELITAIKDIFQEKVTELEPLTGGISNQSFYAVLESGKKLVLRLPEMGYEDVVDRQREKHNCALAASFGISPEVYYFNGETSFVAIHTIKIYYEPMQSLNVFIFSEGNIWIVWAAGICAVVVIATVVIIKKEIKNKH